MNLPHRLDRTVLIRARRATVYSFFTDSARFASWWGPGSTIDAKKGGGVRICMPGATVASGEVVEVVAGERIAFTYGYEGENQPIPPGGSLVTIALRDDPAGTLVVFRHDFADPAVRDHHVQGWRYHLSVFAHVAANAEHAGADRVVARWFAAWNEPDAGARAAHLAACCAPDVMFRDAWSALRGRDELAPQIGAAQQFMPGLRLVAAGPARHCQGTVLADWEMRRGDEPFAAGTNVFELRPDGLIAAVTGVARPQP